MVIFSLEQEAKEIGKNAEEISGKLQMQFVEDKLMHSVLSSDKKTVEHAEMLQEAANQNVGAFTPDMMYAQMTQNFSIAKQILGQRLIRLLTGYDPRYIEKNLNIPEFRKELRNKIQKNIDDLEDEGLIDYEGTITQKGEELSSLILLQHLDTIITKESMGEKKTKKQSRYGDRAEVRDYRKGDRYRDLNVRRTVRKTIKRQHKKIEPCDLMMSTREGKTSISVIYAIDASSSMKGEKLESGKKAGISLAHKAIEEKNKVGLIVFGSEVTQEIRPTNDFGQLLKSINSIKASKQTDFTGMVRKAVELFPVSGETKHLVVLTDAMPTVGADPEKETLKAISIARSAGITTSVIGINLRKKGAELAKQMSIIGEGRLNLVRKLDELGNIVLEDYYSFS